MGKNHPTQNYLECSTFLEGYRRHKHKARIHKAKKTQGEKTQGEKTQSEMTR